MGSITNASTERIIFVVINTYVPGEASYIHLKEKDLNTEVT